ncbi:hypothetical protein [Apibacter adventoris]|uniref:hypothetical protein n=1 Tax=Apibacter adventoris TaxID=1679466 RepID=UPI0011B0D52A|nr:hypothetical protein [Apibacter adventoris]
MLVFFSISGGLYSCQGQEIKKSKPNKKVPPMIEKFDFDDYNKRMKDNPLGNSYLKKDGTKVFINGIVGEPSLYEYLPTPSFLTVYKKYYANGNLKLKETYIGENVKIGISQYYDEKGNLIKEVNEDKKFGKIKPQQVLEFLQEKGYINLKTGKGRVDEDGLPVFELDFYEEKGRKIWYITIRKGKPNNDPSNFPDKGEPSAYIPIIYVMDGETGKVKIEGAEDKKTSGVYKTYEGKDYTREEWEEFEQKQFEAYARKHNISIAKNDKKDTHGFTSRFLLDE